jgi:hyperosmotically inducible protein
MTGQSIRWFAVAAFTTLAVACAQSDAGITTAVKTKLAADTEVKASQINVDTADKVVTLTGAVDTQAAKTRANEIARDTKGVLRVVDNLTVAEATAAGPTTAPFTDAMLTTTVKSKLLADPIVGGLAIDVDTTGAIVTLTGKVKSQAEKDAAIRLAKETEGVKEVNDQLTISVK